MAGGRFGVTWKLVQAQVRPPVRLVGTGVCHLEADSDDDEMWYFRTDFVAFSPVRSSQFGATLEVERGPSPGDVIENPLSRRVRV
jgi:hypothetical protein